MPPGGANACILHYTRNQDKLSDGALVLVDAGAEYAHYAADITRTFPINGRFSPEQRIVYEIVLKAQADALALIKPGLPWTDIQTQVVKSLIQGLLDAGVITGSADEWISISNYGEGNISYWGNGKIKDIKQYGSGEINHKKE